MPCLTTLANAGLLLFILAVTADAVGLLYDLTLLLRGLETITTSVAIEPARGVLILALNAVGLIGLTAHFYLRG